MIRKGNEIKEIEVIKDVLCDKCGKPCKQGDCSPIGEFAILKAHWGYDSGHDMQSYELHICESCFFALIKNFKHKEFTEML